MINIKDLQDINKVMRDSWKSLENYDRRYCYSIEEYNKPNNFCAPYRTLEEALYSISVSHKSENISEYHINRFRYIDDIGNVELDKKDFEIVK